MSASQDCRIRPIGSARSGILVHWSKRIQGVKTRQAAPQRYALQPMFGEWLSLVEHLVRDQGVGGSNPLSPTIYFKWLTQFFELAEINDVDDFVAVRASKINKLISNLYCIDRWLSLCAMFTRAEKVPSCVTDKVLTLHRSRAAHELFGNSDIETIAWLDHPAFGHAFQNVANSARRRE